MSLYLSHPGAAPARIGGYPKRYRQQQPVALALAPAPAAAGPSYADFFASTARSLAG